jgi:hypothetical protein
VNNSASTPCSSSDGIRISRSAHSRLPSWASAMNAGNIGTTKRGMEIKSPPTSWKSSKVSMYTP